MTLVFRMNWSLRRAALEDLARPHSFASERVGFIHCRAAEIGLGIMILAEGYMPVSDDHYVDDATVGARIDGRAIRRALQMSLSKNAGIFHVHTHDHRGMPRPSLTDISESKKLVPDFFNVAPLMPHGALILSEDSAFGLCWLSKDGEPEVMRRIEFVGAPYRIVDILA